METIKKDYSVSMAKANLILIPFMIAVFAIFLGIYYLRMGTIDSEGFFDGIAFWGSFVVGIIIHEMIHGVTWMIAGNIPKDQIKYGFQLKTLTPYAHSKVPMKKGSYMIGAAMPGILLGIIPFLIGVVFGLPWISYFGIVFSILAGGDALILWLIRDVPNDSLVQDHPSQAGCYVFENVTKSNNEST